MLWNYPSIDQLAAELWTHMNAQPVVQLSEATRALSITRDFDSLIEQMDGLSDAEVESAFQAN
jgi:hypothetical protein